MDISFLEVTFSPLQSAFWIPKFLSVPCAKYIHPTLIFPKVSNLKFKLSSKHHQFEIPKSHLDQLNQQQVKILGQNSITCVKVKSLSCVRLFGTPWAIAHQASLSMEFYRQEYCSGLPLPSPGDLPNPGIESGSPILQVASLPSELPGKPYYALYVVLSY